MQHTSSVVSSIEIKCKNKTVCFYFFLFFRVNHAKYVFYLPKKCYDQAYFCPLWGVNCHFLAEKMNDAFVQLGSCKNSSVKTL